MTKNVARCLLVVVILMTIASCGGGEDESDATTGVTDTKATEVRPSEASSTSEVATPTPRTTATATATAQPTRTPSPTATATLAPTRTPAPTATPSPTATPLPPTPTPLPFSLNDLLPHDADGITPLVGINERPITSDELAASAGFVQGIQREYALPPGTATPASPLTVMTVSCYQYDSEQAAETALWAEVATIQYGGQVTLTDVPVDPFADLAIAKEGTPTGGANPTFGLAAFREGPVACLYTGASAPAASPLPTLIDIARSTHATAPTG